MNDVNGWAAEMEMGGEYTVKRKASCREWMKAGSGNMINQLNVERE